MLFRNRADTGNITYWLASRCVKSGSNSSDFCVHAVARDCVDRAYVGIGYSDRFYEHSSSRGVRPIVYLKSDIQTSGKDSSEAWKIELKK